MTPRRLHSACLPGLLWRALVRFAIAGLCLLCLAAAGSTPAPVAPLPVTTKQTAERTAAPGPLGSASSLSTAFLATLTEQERAWLRAHPVIRTFQDPAWPPIEFTDENGNQSGMTKDYLTLIEQRLGQKFEPVMSLSWQEGYERLKRGEIDMAPSEAETPQRLAFWAFTKPYMNIPIVIATQQDVSYIANMHELSGKRVAAVEGFAVTEWMARDFPDVGLIKVKTSLEGLQRLQRGEVDAFIDNLLIIGYYQARHNVLNLKIAGTTPYVNAQRMAVRKDWAPFAAILQKALDSISVAQRDEIHRRWVPIRYEHGFDYTLLWQTLAVCAVVLLGLGLWNRKLLQEVRARKQAEATLKDSEERWKFAIEGAGDGLWDWYIQTGKAFYSLRYKTMLGFEDDEIGDSADEWTRRIHPDDAPGVMAAMQPYMDGKPGSATVEFRMLCKDGSWRWIMGRGMVVERDAQGKPLRMIGVNTDITERKEQQNQLERIAHFDALTDLPNRVLLADRLRQAMAQAHRRGQLLAVAYLDLDGFKAINDQHGHAVGDQVLLTLAQRMKQALREGDTLARLGGDEFVSVLIDLEDRAASVPMLVRLLAAAAQLVQVGDLTVHISASLGVTFYSQGQDIDADQLLRQADQAMYHAKVAGKNRYHIFDAAQDSSLRGHHESLERIRLALENHEFILHYQPKVNMHSGKVIGAEALIRWQHPEEGLLAPAMFLPVIEDHPLAVAIGEWVIDKALTQVELWHAAGLDIAVSVNVGARQLQQVDFVDRLRATLEAHPQVPAGCLELEVLETSALADIAQVSQVIEACASIGVMFALDDFGTGYSSLTYLKRLRVTLLKIDQSFVRDMLDDPDDLAILEGIIGLAVAFKREVIAEGVETVAHGTLLLQLGCELAQGYGIARPMPADQMPAWVTEWLPDAAWSELPWVGRAEQGTRG